MPPRSHSFVTGPCRCFLLLNLCSKSSVFSSLWGYPDTPSNPATCLCKFSGPKWLNHEGVCLKKTFFCINNRSHMSSASHHRVTQQEEKDSFESEPIFSFLKQLLSWHPTGNNTPTGTCGARKPCGFWLLFFLDTFWCQEVTIRGPEGNTLKER